MSNEVKWLEMMPRAIVARYAAAGGCREETEREIATGHYQGVKLKAEMVVQMVGDLQEDARQALSQPPIPDDVAEAANAVTVELTEWLICNDCLFEEGPDEETMRRFGEFADVKIAAALTASGLLDKNKALREACCYRVVLIYDDGEHEPHEAASEGVFLDYDDGRAYIEAMWPEAVWHPDAETYELKVEGETLDMFAVLQSERLNPAPARQALKNSQQGEG